MKNLKLFYFKSIHCGLQYCSEDPIFLYPRIFEDVMPLPRHKSDLSANSMSEVFSVSACSLYSKIMTEVHHLTCACMYKKNMK